MNEENKNEEMLNESAPVEETVEETAEESNTIDLSVEEEEDAEPLIVENVVSAVESSVESSKKDMGKKIAAIAAAAVIVAAVVVLAVVKGPSLFNKYNRMGYVDTSGRTIGEVADAAGMDLADFLEQYELPKNMPANTSESAAYYMIPTKVIAEMYSMDFETLKSEFGFPEEVSEDTPWGEAEGQIPLGKYVGEENLEMFKTEYELGDDVTAETLWKDVRNIVDTKAKEEREAAEKEAEKTAEPTEAPAEATAEAAQASAAPAAE